MGTTQQRAIATCKEDASASGPLSKTAPNTAPTPQWCETWAHYLSRHFTGAAANSIVAVSADGKSYTVSTAATAAFVKQVLLRNSCQLNLMCCVCQHACQYIGVLRTVAHVRVHVRIWQCSFQQLLQIAS
jgi:hypothetical protein